MDEDLKQRLLEEYQRDFPFSATPYADIAEDLGVSEGEVLEIFQALCETGTISRIGAVFKPHSVGASTLAALSAPEETLESVAKIVSDFKEVNHNYEREHAFNLWFVVTADDPEGVDRTLAEIEEKTGCKVLNLPMLKGFHLDLGFKIKWN
ncbi:MAG: Lrp/AsnC family transcriptional regulator [Rhodospirillales bacterium]|nr:Lrp/AsnC family transcriptional regulator [Rhodospirillales bacterium]